METECLSTGNRFFTKRTVDSLKPVLINSEGKFYVKEELNYGWSHYDPQFVNFQFGFIYKRDGTCKAYVNAASSDWSTQVYDVQGASEPFTSYSDLVTWAVNNGFIGKVNTNPISRPTGEKVYKSKILCTNNNYPLFIIAAYPNDVTDDRTAILLTTTDPSGSQTDLDNEAIMSFRNQIHDMQMITNQDLTNGMEELSSDFTDLENTVASVASAATSRFVSR